MVVSLSVDGGLKVGTPRALFDIVPPVSFSATPLRSYDVSPDGKHFVAIEYLSSRRPPLPKFHVVLNWLDELKARAPAAR